MLSCANHHDINGDPMTLAVSVLTAVAAINNAVDVADSVALTDALKEQEAALEGVDEALGSRYLSHFIAVKNEKREVCSYDHLHLFSHVLWCTFLRVFRMVEVPATVKSYPWHFFNFLENYVDYLMS